jgi:hypothetical protein
MKHRYLLQLVFIAVVSTKNSVASSFQLVLDASEFSTDIQLSAIFLEFAT